ncbi:cold shock domain-containing protein [Flavobacterium amniphilum]|uniref:cold-shock protein n=1 Tax=Flavobacterium amniphilum TaxID=1834035 RepID=UPI002029CA64|nr:cold shock domain-containing protein [Flavobacterium amniphilum]MCL9807368.1 cold shock domain-containing protein [Flavobacterium amniphilum]
MNKGIVKYFNDTKGYGFIKEDASNAEYFVHVTALAEPVKQNDAVSFELADGRKGPMAINVKKA